MNLLDDAASLPSLRAALDAVVRRRGAPGPDGITVAAFAASPQAELARLQDELMADTYHPRPVRRIQIAKPGGGHRGLAIGCVRDRVVAHAVAATLSAALDDELHRFAYAYRRGRSSQQALSAVDAALAAGRDWVLRGDVEEFFDRIVPALLLQAVEAATREPRLVDLIGRILAAGVLVGGELQDPGRGTPQGSPLSPFLANLYLTPFDRAVEAGGFEMIRYGDDLCINVVSRADAERARVTVAQALARLRLDLNPRKVEVRHLGESFTFLGFRFQPHGRRPGPRAARALVERLEAASAAEPHEVDDLLRGWLAYYGSLAGVRLPDAVRARAEALEAERTERSAMAELAGRGDAGDAVGIGPPPSAGARAPVAAPADTAPMAGRWSTLAARLTSIDGLPAAEAEREREAVREEAGVPPATWPALVAALIAGDGAAAGELLAQVGRFGDAQEASALVPSARPSRSAPPADPDSLEPTRLDATSADASLLLANFGGAEHTFLRDRRDGDRVIRERVAEPPTVEDARAHLAGAFWMGTYPLRGNNSVRCAGFRVVSAGRTRKPGLAPSGSLPGVVDDDARRLIIAARGVGVAPVVSLEPGAGYMVWFLFAEPIGAARARALLRMIADRVGAPDPAVTRELLPMQDVARPDKPGTPVLMPLGLGPRSGRRAWFCDDELRPVADSLGHLRRIAGIPSQRVGEVLRATPGPGRPPPAPPPRASTVARAAPASRERPPAPAVDAVALTTSPFRDLPRAQEIYAGCAVFRHYVDQAIGGRGLASGDRFLVADAVGRLGDQALPALDAIFRHLDDYRPGLAARQLARLYPHPTSCGRLRQRLPELTAQVGCDCKFRVPPGAYPTPVLHALGAADVPGLGERVRDAARQGGLARAAIATMNEGRRELGARAAALCARLSDLRRQARLLARTIADVEQELDAIVDEAGDAPLETPAGSLRRIVDGGERRFVLEV
jgi:group II intron reverse transcriptase/maturase